jgi:hypothetical protein
VHGLVALSEFVSKELAWVVQTAGSTECHGEGGEHARPEQTLRQGENEDEDRAGARPDSDREHHRHHFAPGNRTGKLPRIDHVIAGLARRVMVAVVIVVMIMVMRFAIVVRIAVMVAMLTRDYTGLERE